MEPSHPLDLASGLDGGAAPEADRLNRAHRRAHLAAGAQGIHVVWLLCIFVLGLIGHPFAESIATMAVDVSIGLAALTVFLFWFWDAYRLAQVFSPEPLASTPGWAVGVFFVPFANFVLPYVRAREIGEASDPSAFSLNLRSSGSRLLVGLWWTSWLVATITGALFEVVADAATTVVVPGTLFGLSAIVSGLMSALLALRLNADQQTVGDYLLAASPQAPEASL